MFSLCVRTGRLVAIAINTDIRTAGLLGYTALTSLLLLAILSNRERGEGGGNIMVVINLSTEDSVMAEG